MLHSPARELLEGFMSAGGSPGAAEMAAPFSELEVERAAAVEDSSRDSELTHKPLQ